MPRKCLPYVISVPTVKGIKHNTQLNDKQMNVPWYLILFDFSQNLTTNQNQDGHFHRAAMVLKLENPFIKKKAN